MGGGKKSKSKSKSKTKTKAQKMATANKAKYGGTAKAAAANKASNKAKAKAKHTASQAAKGKTTTSSASKKTSGVGPVSSGKAYAKAVNSAKNQPTKKTSGVGPVASGKAYAAAVNSAKNAPTKKTSGVGPVASGAKYAQSLKISPPKTGGSGTLLASDYTSGEPTPKMQRDAARDILKSGMKLNEKQTQDLMKQATMKLDTASLSSDPGTLTASLGGGLMAPKSTRFESATGSDAFAQSLGINTDVGGVNYGGLGSIREGGDFNPNANTSRTIRPTGNPNVMSADGTFNRPGPGGPEPEADYTSYQPGSFYNQSDTNMNPTNFLRSARNVVTTPARMLGINNQFTNKLIPKSNEAIQDARDNRRPVTLTRKGGGGGARLPVAAALTPEEILLPEEVAPTEAPTYQQAGLDNNRLMQIQQEAYRQAYNPMTVGGFNPMFRFFGRRQGPRRGAFRRAFTRAA